MDFESMHVVLMMGGGRGHTGGRKYFADVRAELFWNAIYFTNPRPNSGYQSRSCSHRGLGSRYLQIIREYELVTTITT